MHFGNNCNISMVPMSLKILADQTNSFGLIINGDRQKSSLEHETAENLRLKSSLKPVCFKLFTKGGYSSR